ncbi:hypothetical protein ACFPTR_00305 [Aliibacillus thermotolerans]|uniref:Uncharacterized protein n=1 Tax=Aliibacillus thermotolerans TaxID=1834418 RepID=A0ABW0U1L8_9BACI|nr:hypothetical protein [Aliibacillus thermotolerans]MDA3129523.1 hypothetical protein [Aliibacillus thermotolerans]
MRIPKQLNWSEHIFKEREEYGYENDFVPCPLHKFSCKEKCKTCTWLIHFKEEDNHFQVNCRPPVI